MMDRRTTHHDIVTRTSRKIVVFGVALLMAACAEPLAIPSAVADGPQPTLSAAGDRHDRDPVCARRVDIVRTNRASAGIQANAPDTIAESTHLGSGAFQSSLGASLVGSKGLGGQAWAKHNTDIKCDSWSIGKQGLLVMSGSGWGDLRAETVAAPGANGIAMAEAESKTVIEVVLERSAELTFEAHVSRAWLAAVEPNSVWVVCSGVHAAVVRTTFGQEATLAHRAANSCDGSDPDETLAFQWKKVLEPGSYEMVVGGSWAGGHVRARSTGGAAAAHTSAHGDWKFQFTLKEM